MVLNSGEPQDCSALGGRQTRQVKGQCVRVGRRPGSCPAARRKPKVCGGAAALATAGRTDGVRGDNMGDGGGLRTKSRRAQRNRAQRAIRRADGFVVRAARRLRASTAIFRFSFRPDRRQAACRLPDAQVRQNDAFAMIMAGRATDSEIRLIRPIWTPCIRDVALTAPSWKPVAS